MSGFLAVAGKIVTFLLWVLFLVLQTATKVVGGLLQVAPPAEPQEEPQPEAAPRPRSPPAARNSAGGGPADPYDPRSQPWDPPPPPHTAPVTDEYHSSSIYRRRVSAPQAAEDLVVSSSSYSRSAVAAVPASPAHAVPAPPVSRTIKTPAVASKRPKLERKYSKIVDQYRSLDEVCINVCMGFGDAQMFNTASKIGLEAITGMELAIVDGLDIGGIWANVVLWSLHGACV